MSVLLALAAAAALGSGKSEPLCIEGSTIDISQCLGERLKRADADLAKYLSAARVRLRNRASDDDKSAANALKELDQAQKAWSEYRQSECGAVYDRWSQGTIAGIEHLYCQIELTTLRTHTIWSHWLTYGDSTPPLLPEPALTTAP